MRRIPFIACATALLGAGLLTGALDPAYAAPKPQPFASQTISLQPNDTDTQCVLTISWVPTEPGSVAGYLVDASSAPLTAKSKSSIQSKMTNETTATWVIDDNAAFYVEVSVKYVDGRWSKPSSIGAPAWDCLG